MFFIFIFFLSSVDFFFKLTFPKTSFRNTYHQSVKPNSLDSDQARHFVGPDLGPNCLQRLSKVATSRERVRSTSRDVSNEYHNICFHGEIRKM